MAGESEVVRLASKRLGTVLRGKYRIDQILGVGGMAVVYAATHRNKKRFAIKMLHPELSIRDDIRTRFLREGYVANSVEHPGAVAVLDDDVAEDGAAFLVMELLDGAGVEQLWEKRGKRLPVGAVLALSHQLLDVLAAAHAKTVIHRDIKPANVFLTRDGTLKVLDFGIARLRDATSEQATQTGLLMGTPAFMAPEQAIGQSSGIDGLTDVWAVGATMFALLSGSIVHVGDNPHMLLVQAATKPARSLGSVVTGVPAPVVAVIDRALAFDKAHRWPSAAAMRDAVRDACEAVFSSAPSRSPLVELFASEDVGLAPTVQGSVPAPTPAADPVPLTRLSAGSPPVAARTATPVAITPEPVPQGRMIGGTTAQPISSDRGSDNGVKAHKAFGARLVVPAAVIVVLGLGSLVASKFSGQKPPAAPAAQGSPAIPTPMPSITVAAPIATTVASTPSPAAPEAVSAPPTQPGAAVVGKRLPSGPKPPAAKTSASVVSAPPPPPSIQPSSPPPPAPAATPTCTVVTDYDSEGQPHFKKVCK